MLNTSMENKVAADALTVSDGEVESKGIDGFGSAKMMFQTPKNCISFQHENIATVKKTTGTCHLPIIGFHELFRHLCKTITCVVKGMAACRSSNLGYTLIKPPAFLRLANAAQCIWIYKHATNTVGKPTGITAISKRIPACS